MAARESNPLEAPKEVPAKDLDGLFTGPLEEFTVARNELAKELGSAWVKGLAKPSRAAWLVNQLSVRKASEVGRLLEAGERLRAAQEEMLAGTPDREKLREAAQTEQRTVDSLTRAAEAIGREHGVGAPVITRVGETLQAAAGDPEVAEAIERGRLTRERRAASIGLVGTAAPRRRSMPKGGKDSEAAERRARRQLAKRREQLERKVVAAERKLERQRSALERARGAVEAAEVKVHEAELGANAARRELKSL